MFQALLNRIEIRMGKYRGFRNLMTMIVAAMGATYLADLIFGPAMGFYLSELLAFDRAKILQGQIWRMVTFVLIASGQGSILFLLQLVFIYFTGNMLQNRWGTLRFNLFYFCGMFLSVVAGFITGYATNYYLNLSLLLAVAILYPMMQINLYGILPLRMKWLGILELALLLPGIINGSWGVRLAILVSVVNVTLFLSDKLHQQIHQAIRRYQWKKSWRTGNWH